MEMIFNPNQSQQIVNTILAGYKEYLEERNEKARTMPVSDGYAWTKANHIDTAFYNAKKDGQLDFVTKIKKKKAGESWGYLEFQGENPIGKILLIVKNAIRLKMTFEETEGRKASEYLLKYAEINRSFIKEHVGKIENVAEVIKLDLGLDIFEEVLDVAKLGFDAFFSIVYETDSVTKQVNKIEVVVLDPESRKVVSVQDLTEYMATSNVENVEVTDTKDFIDVVDPFAAELGFGFAPKTAEGEEQA